MPATKCIRESNMTQSKRDTPFVQDVALIVGGGPGISSSCARLFAENGMRVCVAARNPEKAVLETLEKTHGVRRYACDASEPAVVAQLFGNVVQDIGTPRLVVHNIDGRVPGIFRKSVIEADPVMALETLRNSAFSAFLVGQHAARLMLGNELDANGAKGTIIFTNASAALKGFPSSGAFAMACHAKSGLAQSMARELMPQGIHIANVPIDAAIGWTSGGRDPRAPAGGNDCRRQYGRPRPYRENLSTAASPTSVDLGVRSRTPTVGREMVTRT